MYLDNTNGALRSGGYPLRIDNFAKAAFESLLDTVILTVNDAVERTEHTASTWKLKLR